MTLLNLNANSQSMNTYTQKQIAEEVGISAVYLCRLAKGLRQPSWTVAKKLANLTNSDPVVWLDGDPEERQQIIKQMKKKQRPAA